LPNLLVSIESVGAAWDTHLSIFDGEEDESGVGLLQQWLVLLLAVDIPDESLSVFFNILLLVDGLDLGDLCDGSGGLELGEEVGLGRLVEIDGGESSGSYLGRGLDSSHGE
jgi:hypothetical protein